jgi:hypothetical protein
VREVFLLSHSCKVVEERQAGEEAKKGYVLKGVENVCV